MDFRILGTFEAVGPAGPIDLRGAKRRGLLACLVVHAGQPMSPATLVDELWGDTGTDAAARTVQTYVSQLRKVVRGDGARLARRPGGYVLEVDPKTVDAYRFEQAVTPGGVQTTPAQRLAALDEALALWRGPPLREFAGATWADTEATRLEGLHLVALQHRFDLLLEFGRAGEAAAELERAARAHPLDERFWALYMLALYRSGRQVDALRAFQEARQRLVDELGIEPGPELIALEHRILDHDPTLVASADASRPIGTRKVPASSPDRWHPRTFLMTDIVQSVSLWERDPAGMADAVERHDRIIEDSVVVPGGQLVRAKGEGDSTISVFSHPAAALTAASAAQAAMAHERWPSATMLNVRIGVHTGDAELRDGAWFGPTVNRAARLRALADGGQTLVSGVTAGLVADQLPGTIRLLYRGRRVLRGIERPEEVWELVAADDPRLPTADLRRPRGLPVVLTRFVGRDADLSKLADLVSVTPLLTLTGPGGSGKTRLALELANHIQRSGETVWLADLAPLRDEGRVVEACAAALGLQTGEQPLDELMAHCEAKAGLLVLDNCEHVRDACRRLIGRLLEAAPELRVLATSREPLGLAGERLWPVQPLAVPEASMRHPDDVAGVESVMLLLDRAQATRPDVALGEADVASVIQICRALDGMPLAIELAAGRLRSLNFSDLAARLDNQLAVLRRLEPERSGNERRHSTLQLTLDWSYDLLSEKQQMLARRLSVFAGGFRLDAAEDVCATDVDTPDRVDTLDGIDELVAKSIVTFDVITARYRLLEPLRQHLATHLAASGETHSAHQAHARWVAKLCQRLGGLGSHLLERQRTHARRLREENGNIDLALHWALGHGDNDTALRIFGSLGRHWLQNDQASGRRWCARVIEVSEEAPPRQRAKVLLSAGIVAQSDAAWDRSIAWLREARAMYQALGLAPGEATVLFWLGRAFALRREDSQIESDAMVATRCFEEGLRLTTQLEDPAGASWFRIWLSSQALQHEDLPRAERLSRQIIDECGPAGVRHPVGQALCDLAFVAYRHGDHDTAVAHLEAAAGIYRDLDDLWQLASVLVELAAQSAVAGHGTDALRALAESTRLDERIGRLSGRAYTLAVAAAVHLARGQTALAAAALGCYDAHPTAGNRPWVELTRSINWLTEIVESTRAQLDPVAVAAAAAAAAAKHVDQLIDEVILHPSQIAEEGSRRRLAGP